MRNRQMVAERVKADFVRICTERGYHINSILSHRRASELVKHRHDVAKALRNLGYSTPFIGLAMDRDHTSILYALGGPKVDVRKQTNRERYVKKGVKK